MINISGLINEHKGLGVLKVQLKLLYAGRTAKKIIIRNSINIRIQVFILMNKSSNVLNNPNNSDIHRFEY
ncbi:MAG: hypothetical protein SVR08_02925 [Spirochaetota bacterium]|nr:hypothetical protein [Spirochaetota bacterium]